MDRGKKRLSHLTQMANNFKTAAGKFYPRDVDASAAAFSDCIACRPPDNVHPNVLTPSCLTCLVLVFSHAGWTIAAAADLPPKCAQNP